MKFSKRFRRKRPAIFKSGQWHFPKDNKPVHNSVLVTDYLTKMSIKTVPHPPYNPDFGPCDFWLFAKLRACPYETMRKWKRLWRRSLTHSQKRTSMGPFRSFWNSTTSVLQPEEITSHATGVSWEYYQ